jgi:hypothetical protein
MAGDFLQTYAPLANDIATRTGLDPAVVLGIIDTETGGGQHVLSNNIFGISPGGKVARYPDVQTASEAFITLMQQPRYAKVLQAPPEAQAQALVAAGYNTVDRQYAAKVGNRAAQIGKQLGYQDQAPAAPAAAPAATEEDPRLAAIKSKADAAPASVAPAATAATAPAATEGEDPRLADLKRRADAGTTPIPSEAPVSTPAFADTIVVPSAVGTMEGQGAVGRVGQAIARGYNEERPDLVTPAGREAINQIPWVGRNVLNPWLDVAGGLMGAAAGGTGQALYETGNAIGGPQLGRDVNMLAQVMPAAMAMPAYATGPSAAAVARAPLPPDPMRARINALAKPPEENLVPGMASVPARVAATIDERPPAASSRINLEVRPMQEGGEGPAPGTGSPTPKSAGAAATPGYEAIHTPAEEQAYRSTAEGKKLLEPQIVGERDLNEYIPGETASSAEREQTAKAARELKELGIRVPEALDVQKSAEQSNNTARTIYAENTAKSPNDIHNRRVEREKDINADKGRVFAPENVTGPVDFQPVIEHMEAVLREPENRQNSALQSAYRDQLERIKKANIEDPREAWGLRRDIDRLTDKRMAADDPNLHYVAHHLDDVANLIDKRIEAVAPGYDGMLAKYKEHSRAMTEMEALQGALKNLRGPGQTMTYNDFQRFMKDVVNGRMSSDVKNPFKAISEDNMQRLWNLRDSLRRTASAKELARAAGSDTMPNIIDSLKAIGKMGGSAALHAYVGAHLGPAGNFALQSLGAIGKGLNERVQIRRATEQMNQMLRPPEPLRVPPGQENALGGGPAPPRPTGTWGNAP